MDEEKNTSICLRISKCLQTSILKLKQTEKRLQPAVILFIYLVSVFGQASIVWGEPLIYEMMPAETSIADTSGLAVLDRSSGTSDGQGENYEIKPNNTIFSVSWGSSGSEAGQFYVPRGIAVDGSGNVYVADTGNGRIQKFDSNGNFLDKWGTWVPIRHCYRSCGWFCCCHDICTDSWDPSPIAIAVDTKGNIYVLHNTADWFREVASQVFKYDNNGHFLTRWGPPLSKMDQFPPLLASGLAVDSLNNVYVTFNVFQAEAVANNMIQKFDSNGNLIKQWGALGSGDGQFFNPLGITVASYGYIYIADTGNDRIQKFEQTFKIKGAVKEMDGIPMVGVLMTLGGDASKTVKTDSFGKYTFKNVSNGSYTVTPRKAGYDFTPVSTDVAIYGNHAVGKNFTGTTFSISGVVKKANGSPIAGVRMTLSGDTSKTVTTDSKGKYKFNRIASGNYTIVPNKAGFTFAPTSITLSLSGASVTDEDFTGTKN